MKPGVKVTLDRTRELTRAVEDLTRREVLVGIPADEATRDDDGPVTNAQLGFIHEYGSPARNIPARPFLMPGIKAAQEQLVAQLKAAGQQALSGNISGITVALNRAGLIAQNSVRAKFVDNDWPPLSDATLDRRPPAKRDEHGQIIDHGKSRRETGAVNPLIHTGQLRKSITYVVREKS